MTTTNNLIDRFAVFILTHGRPNEVVTYNSLIKSGYTGKIYIIIDDEDIQADEYKKIYKDLVIQVSNKKIAKTFDIADSIQNRNSVIYKRNASFEVAKNLGLDYFMQLDDDYNGFCYRYIKNYQLKSIPIRSMNQVLETMITFLEDTDADTVAMAQGGDYIGGAESKAAKTPVLRKAMNSFIFRTNRPVTFIGRMNDDVNTYTMNGIRGKLFLTPTSLAVMPVGTQKVKGGMTEIYLENGTYTKSFYTVMMAPSCVTVKLMQTTHSRPHHRMKWVNTVPKIISDKHRKPR